MKKSELKSMPEYFDRYININDDADHLVALETSLNELKTLPIEKLNKLGDQIYEPGKWTIKDIFQHLIDAERVFAYRSTAFARGDQQQMLSFDENLFAQNAQTNLRNLNDLVEELTILRQSSIAQYKSYSNQMLQNEGTGYNGIKYSVLAIGFIIPGHQRWHMSIIEQRYFPLLLGNL
ncbi:MAG: DinB family protein [Saprospiraceae bacterium]